MGLLLLSIIVGVAIGLRLLADVLMLTGVIIPSTQLVKVNCALLRLDM